ncbi:MAG: hypothetical protein HRT54_15915 [Colwellia sp.]|nr:hypothetical protein [Colwellia sp.]
MILKDDFRKFANLINNESEEFDIRNKASRLYYYLFHSIREFIDTPLYDAKGGTHAQLANTLIQGYLSHPEKMKYIRLGVLMKTCLSIRCEADYDIQDEFSIVSIESLEDNIGDAIQILDQLKASA